MAFGLQVIYLLRCAFCTATASVHLFNYIYTMSVTKQQVELMCWVYSTSLLHTTDIPVSPVSTIYVLCLNVQPTRKILGHFLWAPLLAKGCISLSHIVTNIVLV